MENHQKFCFHLMFLEASMLMNTSTQMNEQFVRSSSVRDLANHPKRASEIQLQTDAIMETVE